MSLQLCLKATSFLVKISFSSSDVMVLWTICLKVREWESLGGRASEDQVQGAIYLVCRRKEQNFNMPNKPSLIHVLSLLSVKTFFDKRGSVCSI